MSVELDPIRGVLVQYGTVSPDQKRGAVILDDDLYKYVEYVFSYNDLPTYAVDGYTATIPSGATIQEVSVDVITTFAGAGTETFDIGLYTPAGVAVDANGLVAAAAITSLTAGSHVAGAGAVVGTNTTADTQVVVAASAATVTAGKARLLIKYTPKPAATA